MAIECSSRACVAEPDVFGGSNPWQTVRESFLNKGYAGSNYIYIQEPGSMRYAVDLSSDDEDLHVVLSTHRVTFYHRPVHRGMIVVSHYFYIFLWF